MEMRTYARMVRVQFPCMSRALDYLNDRFDLQVGDLVYVDGKLEGIRGTVVAVGVEPLYQISAYKQVVDRVDTRVAGQLFLAGSCCVAFDPGILPYDKLLRWFRGPVEQTPAVRGRAHEPFSLAEAGLTSFSNTIARRGVDYYREGRVQYLSLEGGRCRAIVEGVEHYEVEFQYRDGRVSDLGCSCLCEGLCKHQAAALEQLRQLLELIRLHYGGHYREGGYFAAVRKTALLRNAVAARQTGSLILS